MIAVVYPRLVRIGSTLKNIRFSLENQHLIKLIFEVKRETTADDSAAYDASVEHRSGKSVKMPSIAIPRK